MTTHKISGKYLMALLVQALLHTGFVAAQQIDYTGSVSPTPPGGSSWHIGGAGLLAVGYTGNGTLTISGGAQVSNEQSGILGYGTGVTGEVTVDGDGSTWTSNYINVGRMGTGILTVSNGGYVSSNYSIVLGDLDGASGKAIVDGVGSTLHANGGFFVGGDSYGELHITNGGLVSNSASAGVALSVYNVTETRKAFVTGTGEGGVASRWIIGEELFVGRYQRSSGELHITDGGQVSSNGGKLGEWEDSIGKITIDGKNSTWTNNGNLHVGIEGSATLAL
ncbi:MAG: hypothetical protein FWD53_07195, partial [Phycisphaerales bacterium]|nr:hypothetical protein [Phycisphaerales bacterium]